MCLLVAMFIAGLEKPVTAKIDKSITRKYVTWSHTPSRNDSGSVCFEIERSIALTVLYDVDGE
jgi:hypothetical protein